MNNIIVLAAGRGSRLKSDLPKIYHRIFEKEFLSHIYDQFDKTKFKITFVINSQYISKLKQIIGEDVNYVIDDQQIGTGNSVRIAMEGISKDLNSKTIILNGDCPLFRSSTIEHALEYSKQTYSDLTLVTANPKNTFGYGRVVKKYDEILKIVEQKDATEKELNIKEVNTGTYIIDTVKLKEHISKLESNNVQKEYYLTDIIEIFIQNHLRCNTFPLFDETEMYNINDRVQMEQVTKIMQSRVNIKHLTNGVTIYDINNTYIGPDVVIGHDTIIYPGNYITGKTVIGKNNILLPNNYITNSVIDDNNNISNSVISDSKLGSNSQVGPFAHIRATSELKGDNRIGNFVEVKNSTIDTNSKSAHLSYLGDSKLGKNINIGCGTITVNYDGVKKHTTVIEDDVFVGCNANLIAPVTIGKGALVAAGTTVTNDVEQDSFVIGRSRQEEKLNYAPKIWNKLGKKNVK